MAIGQDSTINIKLLSPLSLIAVRKTSNFKLLPYKTISID